MYLNKFTQNLGHLRFGMSDDFDRISLDQRINKLETMKFHTNNNFPSIDFDQHPDNSIIRNKDGIIFKYSGELPVEPYNLSNKIYVCGITIPSYGLVTGRSLLTFKIDAKTSSRPAYNVSSNTYFKIPFLGEDCSSLVLDGNNSGLLPELYICSGLFAWFMNIQNNMLLSFIYPRGVCLRFIGNALNIPTGVYFGRGIIENTYLLNNQGCGFHSGWLGPGRIPSYRYNNASDLPDKWKPLFPASWSV